MHNFMFKVSFAVLIENTIHQSSVKGLEVISTPEILYKDHPFLFQIPTLIFEKKR